MDYHRPLTIARWLSGFALALAVPLADGCTSRTTSSDLCDQVCDCETCTEEFLEMCRSSSNEQADVAMKDGCEDEYQAYIECLDSEFRCEDGEAVTAQCARELSELTECSPDSAPVPVGCEASLQAIQDKAESCGLPIETTGTGGLNPCDDPTQAEFIECFTPCYLTASCAALNGGPGSNELTECLLGCFDTYPGTSTGTSTPGTATATGSP